eukprot:COSAG06_NODE_335_length_17284_cov_12.707594_2_plen_130_part_00
MLPCPVFSTIILCASCAEGNIDGFILLDIEFLRCETFGGLWEMVGNQCRGLLNCCISDTAKQLLLNHPGFIPHLVSGLLLDPHHPRNGEVAPGAPGAPQPIKSAVQRDFGKVLSRFKQCHFPLRCVVLC